MTLADLYTSLDWSGTGTALTRWATHVTHSEHEPVTDFAPRLRQALLLYALPQELVGPQPDWTPERQQAARAALATAGVWDQVVDWLVTHQLIGPSIADDATHLVLPLN